MAVPAVITDLLVAVADNVPKGTDAVTTSTGPDEYFRAHAAIVRRLQAKGADVASAATVDLGAINDGSYVKITGTTTITSFGTIAAGVERTLLFADALTLTHDVTKIILPGGVNIVTVAEDVAVFVSEGAGLWRCKSYQRKAVPPSVPLDASVVTAKIADDAVTYAKIQNVSATDKLLGRATAGAGDVEEITCTPFARTVLDDSDAATARTTLGLNKTTIQSAFAGTGAVVSTTSIIPYDDTIPQITEGGEALSITFTPVSATSRIRIRAVLQLRASGVALARTAAIFIAGNPDALGVGASFSDYSTTNTGLSSTVAVADIPSPGTTAQTFSVRFGPHATGTMYLNANDSGARVYGGKYASTLEIEEYLP